MYNKSTNTYERIKLIQVRRSCMYIFMQYMLVIIPMVIRCNVTIRRYFPVTILHNPVDSNNNNIRKSSNIHNTLLPRTYIDICYVSCTSYVFILLTPTWLVFVCTIKSRVPFLWFTYTHTKQFSKKNYILNVYSITWATCRSTQYVTLRSSLVTSWW